MRVVDLPDAAPADLARARIATSGGHAFALLTPENGGAVLARYDRATGLLDPSFGSAGYCDLTSFDLANAAALALTSDGKVVILANGFGELIVGRLWL